MRPRLGIELSKVREVEPHSGRRDTRNLIPGAFVEVNRKKIANIVTRPVRSATFSVSGWIF